MRKELKQFFKWGIYFSILGFLLLYISKGGPEFYFRIKYGISKRSIEIMWSILFSFSFLEYFFDCFYFYVLSRNQIIVRIGRIAYYRLIQKRIFLCGLFFLVFNLILDFFIIESSHLDYLLGTTMFMIILFLLLPKRREYTMELLISLILAFVVRLMLYHLF